MSNESKEYECKIAKTVEEARRLLEEGFDCITEIEGMKLFRRRN
jgi:NAD/NADP transhydrogenase alpha subunit